jgi:hypothetical protein
MDPHILAEFNNCIAGEVVVPASNAYDELRHQAGSPAEIVRGQCNDDIVTALRFAREHHLSVSVRGGGNFGVVTSFDFHAHPCKTIVGGEVVYDAAEVETVLADWASSMREAPEELNSTIVLFSGFGPQVPPRITVRRRRRGRSERCHQALPALRHRAITRYSKEAVLCDAGRRSVSSSVTQDGWS